MELRTLIAGLCACYCTILAADRVPPYGLAISVEDKAALQGGITRLEGELAKVPSSDPLLPEARFSTRR